MLTVCWAAKGGSGTTVTTAVLGLAHDSPALAVDLAGDLAPALGIDTGGADGTLDWLGADAPVDRLRLLELPVTSNLRLIPAGTPSRPALASTAAAADRVRWRRLAEFLAAEPRMVAVDAGTGEPPPELIERATVALLVTRSCYLALWRAQAQRARPTGVVLVDEPGRSLRDHDVEAAVGAPIVARVLLDPKIARATDAGLAVARLPVGCLSALRAVA
jgi:hypothetical protein